MIISLHVTHSAAGVEAMSNVAQMIESNIPKYLGNTISKNEYVILRTCNRFEIYVGGDDTETVKNEFESFVKNTIPCSKDLSMPFILQGKDSIKHLFRVSCGLDSLIVGEDHIQGQVREAYMRSKKEGHVSKNLSVLFDRALSVGKRVRTETKIGAGSVSVGRAAVETAERDVGGLKDKTITIVGAGSLAAAIGKNLFEKGAHAVFISSRTYERATQLAYMVGGTALSMDYLVHTISISDILFVATSAPHILISPEIIKFAGERMGPLLIVDVSVPKNVDDAVSDIPHVSLKTMDSLKEAASENIAKRMSEISRAEHIVSEEIARMDAKHLEEKADLIIGEISRKAVAIREEEVFRAKTRARTANLDEVFDDMSRAILSKMLADTYEKIRSSSVKGESDLIDAAKDLFGLEMK